MFLCLLIIRFRNTAQTSFVLFLSLGALAVGVISASITEHYIYLVFATIVAEVFTLPYLIIKAFDNPQKREAKKVAKKAAELAAIRDQDSITKEQLAEIEAKHQKLLEVNKDLISKLSSFFSNDNSMENFLDYCNDMVTQRVNADGCVILMSDDYDNSLAVKSFKGSFPPPYKLPDDLPHKPIRVETNLRFAQFQLEGNIFGELFKEGVPVLIADSVKDPRVYQNGPEDFLRCGSYIFAPIKQHDAVVGLLALARVPGKAKFSKEEFDSAVILADAISTTMNPLYSFLAYAEHTELNKGGSIASKYQKDLIPAKLPVIPGLQIGCYSNPVEGVCGDFYDILVSRKDRISFIVSDVAGKGMNSLIVMIMIRAILRLSVNTEQSAATILAWTNRGICIESSKIDHFASVALINYNSTKKEAEIATCGNNPVFLYKAASKSFEQLTQYSEPMGVTKDTVYTDIKVQLEPGDILASCTDGLLESLNENGVQYSAENFKKVIVKNASISAKDISNKVKDDLKKYCGTTQQYDDQSLLVLKIQ